MSNKKSWNELSRQQKHNKAVAWMQSVHQEGTSDSIRERRRVRAPVLLHHDLEPPPNASNSIDIVCSDAASEEQALANCNEAGKSVKPSSGPTLIHTNPVDGAKSDASVNPNVFPRKQDLATNAEPNGLALLSLEDDSRELPIDLQESPAPPEPTMIDDLSE
ncbi:hypothetical protein QAD02_003025 [Eretmocerus hayati]|uniref:Uncharacterized protein n=1 Tax=Eretmocerus hayati TaxID=131215 RepID=A0ACC2NKY1_9HYME|nr:hypothetical protein QAD02_003025 [Eretmocerus hayati]